MLYECLTGNTPYPGDTLEQQITAHLTAPPPCPSSTDPNIPVAFDTVIATGMAKTPDERYQTTVQLSDAARNAITSSIAAAGPTMQAVPPGGQPDPSAVTQLRPPPQPPQPSSGQETHRPRDRRVWWGAIAGGMAVIAVVVTVVVMTNRDSGAGSASAPSSTPAPNTGPFTGTFSVDFGPLMTITGAPVEGEPPTKETWNLRSECGANGCVATASRTSGNTLLSSTLVFDDVGGRWLAMATAPGKCQDADAERWEVFSLQPRPDGTLAGEYTNTSPAACGSKRTVTFTRTGDTRVDLLSDPASLPARVASPAEALHGRYQSTITFASGAAPQKYDLVVRTDCFRNGERCMSFFHSAENMEPLVFANGKWVFAVEFDTPCPDGGTSHSKINADYPLPQPPQGPITLLTGHGNKVETGSACSGGDFDEKFVRTGD